MLPESNCLSKAGNTVLMNDWCLATDAGKAPELEIRIEREGGLPSGTLSWTTAQTEYVTVELLKTETPSETLPGTETGTEETLADTEPENKEEQNYRLKFIPNQAKLQEKESL